MRAVAAASLLALLLCGGASAASSAAGAPATLQHLDDEGHGNFWLGGDDGRAVFPEPAPPLPALPPAPPAPPAWKAAREPAPPEAPDQRWLDFVHSTGWRYEATDSASIQDEHATGSMDALPAAATGMISELAFDAQELDVAATPTPDGAHGQAAAVPPAGAPTWSFALPGGWTAELQYNVNESSYGFSNRPKATANGGERGAFDIRAGWAMKRRFVQLPASGNRMAGVQEVLHREFYFSISAAGLAIICLAAAAAVAAVWKYMAEEEEEQDEGDEEAGQKGDYLHTPFIKVIQESGYEKL
ncbi:hypothetical protein ACK3TF_000402 [Chlorella vulgaris]